jgi:hypothetical protein
MTSIYRNMEDNLNFEVNGRQIQLFWKNGRQPQYYCKLEDILTFFKLEDDFTFFKFEDDLPFFKLEDNIRFFKLKTTSNF